MKSKKSFYLLFTFTIFLIGSNTILLGQEPNDPNNKIKVLQEKIKQLESSAETKQKTINRLEQKLDKQIKENERLKNLCSQAGIDISPQKDKKSSKVEDPNIINVSLEQLYQFLRGPLTELQKKELYKNYEGKWVQWTGRISSISNLIKDKKNTESYYQMKFIYQNFNSRFTADVRVEFPETMKQRLLSLNTGSLITYQGRLPDYHQFTGFYNGNLTLTDGKIISVEN